MCDATIDMFYGEELKLGMKYEFIKETHGEAQDTIFVESIVMEGKHENDSD